MTRDATWDSSPPPSPPKTNPSCILYTIQIEPWSLIQYFDTVAYYRHIVQQYLQNQNTFVASLTSTSTLQRIFIRIFISLEEKNSS